MEGIYYLAGQHISDISLKRYRVESIAGFVDMLLIYFRTYAEPKFERSPCRPVLHRRCNRRVNFSPAALATSHRPTLPITLSFGAMIRSIVSYAARSGPPGRCGSTCAIRFHSATRGIYSLTTRCSTSDIRISLKWYDDSGAATPTQ